MSDTKTADAKAPETVNMDDGRLVDFAGKRKLLKSSSIDSDGTIRVRLQRGTATVVGRQAKESLYDRALATYDRGDTYDQSAAVGFINIWGLQTRVQARQQLLGQLPEALKIAMPREDS